MAPVRATNPKIITTLIATMKDFRHTKEHGYTCPLLPRLSRRSSLGFCLGTAMTAHEEWVNSDLSDMIHEFLWLQLKHWGLNGFGLWGY